MIRTMIQIKGYGREARVLTKCTKCKDIMSKDELLSYGEAMGLSRIAGTWVDSPNKKCYKCELVLLDASGDEV